MEGQRRGRKSTLSYCVQKSIEEIAVPLSANFRPRRTG